jgi:hypothetical protein
MPVVDPESEFPWHHPDAQIQEDNQRPEIDMSQFHDPWEIYKGHIPPQCDELPRQHSLSGRVEDHKEMKKHAWEYQPSHSQHTQYVQHTQHVQHTPQQIYHEQSHHNPTHDNSHQPTESFQHHTENHWEQHSQHSQGHNFYHHNPSQDHHWHQNQNSTQEHHYQNSEDFLSQNFKQDLIHYEHAHSSDHYQAHPHLIQDQQSHNHVLNQNEAVNNNPNINNNYPDQPISVTNFVQLHYTQHHNPTNNSILINGINRDNFQLQHYEVVENVENLDEESPDNTHVNGVVSDTECDYYEDVRPRHPYDDFYLRHRVIINSHGHKICTHEIPQLTPSPSTSPQPQEVPIFLFPEELFVANGHDDDQVSGFAMLNGKSYTS